jgi:hypothetical protein
MDSYASDQVAIDLTQWLEAMERRTSGQRYLKFSPEFALYRKGFDLCLHLLHQLGESRPPDLRDRVQRDLSCDTLDSLRGRMRGALRL